MAGLQLLIVFAVVIWAASRIWRHQWAKERDRFEHERRDRR